MSVNPFQVGDVLATRPEQSLVLRKEDNGLLLKKGDQHIWALGVDMELDEDENWRIVWEKAYYFDDIAIVPDLKELTQYDNCTTILSNSLWYVIDDQNCALLLTSSFFPDELPGDEVVVVPPFISCNNQRYEVTGVADWAFFKNEQILNIKLPDSVTNIGKHAFTGASLKKISFQENVLLGENAFYGCNDLELNTLTMFVSYNGFTEDVANLKEGMVLADDLISSEGGDINIRRGEETIAYREWFAFDDLIDGMDNPASAECNPIIFDGVGFYSDWVIDTDWEQDAQIIPRSEYRTFGEFLNSGQELDCELIIGDEEMDMSFVWDADDRITHYGYKQFRDLMDCPYEVLSNGNISLDDGNAEQGNRFVTAAAGYISQSETLKIFTKAPESEVDLDHEM